jgi:glycosyltransferase involved in cell wall biosynthesis
MMRSADLLFLPMHDIPRGERAGLVPGKTYEYLATRRPILGAVPEGDARDLLVEAGNAHVCDPPDSACMARAITSEVERWRKGLPTGKPREEVVARYERRNQAQQIAELFDSVLHR